MMMEGRASARPGHAESCPSILFLAFRTPCGGSPANCRATQHRFVSRTFSADTPAFMNQPCPRQCGIIRTDDAQRFACDKLRRAKKFGAFSGAQFAGRIFARHKISSAIQLPIPENPDCIRTTALIGALRWR